MSYVVFVFKGESWNDVSGRVCVSHDYPSFASACRFADWAGSVMKYNTEIVEVE